MWHRATTNDGTGSLCPSFGDREDPGQESGRGPYQSSESTCAKAGFSYHRPGEETVSGDQIRQQGSEIGLYPQSL